VLGGDDGHVVVEYAIRTLGRARLKADYAGAENLAGRTNGGQERKRRGEWKGRGLLGAAHHLDDQVVEVIHRSGDGRRIHAFKPLPAS